MNIYNHIRSAFYFIGMFIVWCTWVMLGLLFSYTPGWRGGYSLRRFFELQKRLEKIPYMTIVALAKNQGSRDNARLSSHEREALETVSPEDMLFYVFMMNKKIRLGLRAFMAILMLCAAIFLGADWLVLYALIALLFLFGILQIAQGSMEIF